MLPVEIIGLMRRVSRETYLILTDASRNSRHKSTHFDSYDKARFGILGTTYRENVEKFRELLAVSLFLSFSLSFAAEQSLSGSSGNESEEKDRLRILIGRSAVKRYRLYRVCRANSEDSQSFAKVIRRRDAPITTTMQHSA